MWKIYFINQDSLMYSAGFSSMTLDKAIHFCTRLNNGYENIFHFPIMN